jgi:hypothetical protein
LFIFISLFHCLVFTYHPRQKPKLLQLPILPKHAIPKSKQDEYLSLKIFLQPTIVCPPKKQEKGHLKLNKIITMQVKNPENNTKRQRTCLASFNNKCFPKKYILTNVLQAFITKVPAIKVNEGTTKTK